MISPLHTQWTWLLRSFPNDTPTKYYLGSSTLNCDKKNLDLIYLKIWVLCSFDVIVLKPIRFGSCTFTGRVSPAIYANFA
jgi:hypothetical protein